MRLGPTHSYCILDGPVRPVEGEGDRGVTVDQAQGTPLGRIWLSRNDEKGLPLGKGRQGRREQAYSQDSAQNDTGSVPGPRPLPSSELSLLELGLPLNPWDVSGLGR